MATSSGKKSRKSNVTFNQQPVREVNNTAKNFGKIFPKLEPKSYVQQDYIDAIKESDIVFALGSAGSGKSYVATHYAAEQLYYKRIDKIIITRPAVAACGENLGFLPGELVEGKLMPYLQPYMETFNELLGKSFTEYCLKSEAIEAVPMGFLRGRTFKNCIVLADEMENATPLQLKLILTRIGENCKMLLNGDLDQQDIKGISGLEDAVKVLSHLDQVEVIKFGDDDVVRSGLCRDILRAYRY